MKQQLGLNTAVQTGCKVVDILNFPNTNLQIEGTTAHHIFSTGNRFVENHGATKKCALREGEGSKGGASSDRIFEMYGIYMLVDM